MGNDRLLGEPQRARRKVTAPARPAGHRRTPGQRREEVAPPARPTHRSAPAGRQRVAIQAAPAGPSACGLAPLGRQAREDDNGPGRDEGGT
ncbi:hypothetical protein ABGB18_25440 [Nonomuraea sp. B12E4]|uniref:hypothetical protein n=1 Tax=Nonomuraea sp. B12E4 TaxID=3153564 RepID=UPI00325CA853